CFCSQSERVPGLRKQGLVEGISANSDPIVNGNSGVLAISASLTDKGLANRDQVVAAIFSYLNLLREKGIDKQYFDELANVLDIDFRYPSITRDMDYVEWLIYQIRAFCGVIIARRSL
ncbi:insulinase family protein, partial [Escherichia sp. TWPC-MK]